MGNYLILFALTCVSLVKREEKILFSTLFPLNGVSGKKKIFTKIKIFICNHESFRKRGGFNNAEIFQYFVPIPCANWNKDVSRQIHLRLYLLFRFPLFSLGQTQNNLQFVKGFEFERDFLSNAFRFGGNNNNLKLKIIIKNQYTKQLNWQNFSFSSLFPFCCILIAFGYIQLFLIKSNVTCSIKCIVSKQTK